MAINKKALTKRAKSVFKFEKEHKTDPSICKCCGKKIGVSFLIGGICKPCHQRANILGDEYKKGFKVNKIEISSDIGDLM